MQPCAMFKDRDERFTILRVNRYKLLDESFPEFDLKCSVHDRTSVH